MNTSTPKVTPPALPSDGSEQQAKGLSLLDYFETQFVPSRATSSTAYLSSSRRAAHLFCSLIGELPVRKINQELLHTYKQRLVEAGYSEKTAESYGLYLVAVVRSAYPEAIPDRRLLRGNGVAGAVARWTDERVLVNLFRLQFAPQQLADCSNYKRRQYTAGIAMFDDFLGRPARLCDLTDESLTNLVTWLSNSQRSAGSVTSIRDHLMALWCWCVGLTKGRTNRPPARSLCRCRRREVWHDSTKRLHTAAAAVQKEAREAKADVAGRLSRKGIRSGGHENENDKVSFRCTPRGSIIRPVC